MAEYLKGQIAKLANINSETLRYYEKNKIIPEPERSKAGYRLYSQEVLQRLEFIKNAKASGFTLKQIKEMFDIAGSRDVSTQDILSSVDEKISEIDSKIENLSQMKKDLVYFKEHIGESVKCPHIQSFLNNFDE
ncbi:MAG: MerR family transcriptional regulator [Bacillota bacterium]|nr:MerR family transcriptional regulator [Bacillota bacterium]